MDLMLDASFEMREEIYSSALGRGINSKKKGFSTIFHTILFATKQKSRVREELFKAQKTKSVHNKKNHHATCTYNI